MIAVKSIFRVFILLFVLSMASPSFLHSQELDLSRNFGWASQTRGGYGGKIIRVTNLKSSGPGSLLEAIKTRGKRIVVFEVSGEIDLNGGIWVLNIPNLTILGQTAPSPGITIRNGSFMIRTNELIIQHLRFRMGTTKVNRSLDVMTTDRASSNIIIDHCSLMWAVDENLSASGPSFSGNTPEEWRKNTSHNITFSNNIIGEGLSRSVHRKGEHSMGTLVSNNVTNILIMRNLYTCNNDRNPLFAGGVEGIYLNNYIYNPGIRSIWHAISDNQWKGKKKQTTKLSVIGNILQKGRDTDPGVYFFLGGNGPLRLYLDDNKVFNYDGVPSNQLYKGDANKLIKTKEVWYSNLITLKAENLKDYILENVGARPWDRDSEDQRIINDVRGKKGHIISSEREVMSNIKAKSNYSKFVESDWDMKTLRKKR
ncbi:pectate lyase family protein [Sphingobacterium siyangense]